MSGEEVDRLMQCNISRTSASALEPVAEHTRAWLENESNGEKPVEDSDSGVGATATGAWRPGGGENTFDEDSEDDEGDKPVYVGLDELQPYNGIVPEPSTVPDEATPATSHYVNHIPGQCLESATTA